MARSHGDTSGAERTLVHGADGSFAEAELEGLPEPVKRYFRSAVAPGTPLSRTVRIEMRGFIKRGVWLPFRARQVLSPLHGSLWAARVAGIISGSDRYADGHGAMTWTVGGLVRVMHAEGPDVSRSGAERAAGEAIWLPTALLPRFGVAWSAHDDTHITARFSVDDKPVTVEYELHADGRPRSVALRRWGDPDNTGQCGEHPFGGSLATYATFAGLTIPDEGAVGWHYGTEQWNKGEFFRFRITRLTPVTEPA